MCGILGLYAPNTRPDLTDKLALLQHRGPDDEGGYTGDGIYLGARRLSIIDVAGGHQPLSTEDGRVWVVQNGEIYNYLALRRELEALGHTFRTRSDTEVIAYAYEAWGDSCVERLRGIFAFAVWDAERRRLLLARDRFGVKPLHYAPLPGGGLAFASEIRPLLGLLPSAPRPDLAALRAMFVLGHVPGPRTGFEGIHELPAAARLICVEGEQRLERYWDLGPALAGNGHEPDVSADEAAHGLRLHLERAVAEQRMSEVPLGALLSGGVDSTAVAALLQGGMSERLHTFNIGFEHADYDETPHAALAADRLGTEHHQITFSAADFDRYPEVVAHLEEPQCSATALPIFRLYEACREAGLVVILTGEGADELLGGYHWFHGDARMQPLLGLPRAVRQLVAASPAPMSAAARRVLRSGPLDALSRYAAWLQPGGPETEAPFAPEFRAAPQADVFPPEARAAAGWDDPFRQFQYFEMHTRLVDFINFEVDRMSMAHSIEARVPFLDHELWEYCARLPSRLLLSGELSKSLLRTALRDRLPPEILARQKQGLAAPYAAWLRAERLSDWAEAALDPAALRRAGYFEAAAVARLRAEHQAGRADHSRLLMGVLSTQAWHAEFIERAP
jgi:asparagine synthase (glutamine-hydrolysing)